MTTPSPSIKISIITVTLNAAMSLKKTIESVTSQSHRDEFEYIVIDGQSVDESLDVLESYKDKIDVLICSKDRSVYDAMNKGIKAANGEWLYFLNAGDVLLDENSISRILKELKDIDVLYSDVQVNNDNSTYIFKTSFDHHILNHQGFVYRRNLHEKYGPYAVINGFTAADYFYFLQLDNLKVRKLETPIAIFQSGGLSSTVKAVRQKYCLDFISGKISALNLAFRLVVYPLYRAVKKIIR
jgi:glycosyltransferase involved in cell wall biosynthesis